MNGLLWLSRMRSWRRGYPYVEVAGRAVEAKVNTRFSFRDIAES